MSSPLESLKKSVDTTLVIISAVSIVILTLLLTIWVRGRKREMGILLSLGKNKANIIMQIFTETFAVAVISFLASIPFSFLAIEKAGEFLTAKAATEVAKFHVQMDTAYLPILYLIGILLTAVSVIGSSWTVVRLQPKDILTKMS